MTIGAASRWRSDAISIETIVDYVRSVIDEVSAVDISSAARTDVSLPCLSADVISFDPDITEAVRTNFVSARASPAPVMKTFVVHPGVKGVSPPAPWNGSHIYRQQQVSEILVRANLQGSFFYDLDHWHIYDAGAGVAVQLMRAPGQYPPWEPGAPLRPFLHWHYARQGMRLSHCGTLAVDGKGIILGGEGGSGKSGAVIAGLLHGLQSVGDDYVLVEMTEEISAFPLFATLKQDLSGFRRLGLDRRLGEDLRLNWQGKYQFRMADISCMPVPEKIRIEALLLPHVGRQERSEIRPVSRAEAMVALAASSIHQMPGERESGFRFFAEVTRRLPCFTLTLGSDPREIVQTVSEFIEGITT